MYIKQVASNISSYISSFFSSRPQEKERDGNRNYYSIQKKPMKVKKHGPLHDKLRDFKQNPLMQRLIATKSDTIRLREKLEYHELINRLGSNNGGILSSLYPNMRYNNAETAFRTPAKAIAGTSASSRDHPLTTQKVSVPELMEISEIGWHTKTPTTIPPSTSTALVTSTPLNVAGPSRFTLYSDNFHMSPFTSSPRNATQPVATVDLTQDEEEQPSTSQSVAVVPWSEKSTATRKIDDLQYKIRAVMDRSFGSPSRTSSRTSSRTPTKSRISVVDLTRETNKGTNVTEVDLTDDDDVKENDDEIQVLSESLISKSPVNSLALEFSNINVTKDRWLNEGKSTFAESRRDKAEQIKREETALTILRNESTIETDLAQRVRRNLTLTDIIILEEKAPELPEITKEMQAIINKARGGYNQNEVLKRTPTNIEITRGDIRSLAPTKWLNDNVINSYLDMIALRSKESQKYPKVYVFTTFFYPKFVSEGHSNILKRWTRKVDIFSYDLLIFPIHLGIHWCLAVADLRHKTIKYYDSMGGKNYGCPKSLLQYLCKEHMERKKSPLNEHEWKTEVVEDIPQQENGSDCGMFACKFAEYLSRDSKLSFHQEDMNYYRERMIYEIIEQDLLYP